MTDNPTITDNDILSALQQVLTSNTEEGMTTREIMRSKGWSKQKTIEALQELDARGVLVSGRAYRKAIDGVNRPYPVYRIKSSGD